MGGGIPISEIISYCHLIGEYNEREILKTIRLVGALSIKHRELSSKKDGG